MPDPKTLKVGDRIRIVGIPEGDRIVFEQRNADYMWLGKGPYICETTQVLEWMVGKEFKVEFIDDLGRPWVDVEGYPDSDGGQHSMAIFDKDSWVLATPS